MVCCNKLGKLNHLIPSWVWGTQLSTSEVAKLFFASWVWYDGVPKWLAHNHDVHFTAIFWCVLWAMLGMQTLFSSAYHPQTNGQTEHQNRTVEQLIHDLICKGVDNWVEAIPLVELCVNNTVVDLARVLPAAFTYDKSLCMPVYHLDRLHPNQVAHTTVKTWQTLSQQVQSRLVAAQKKQKKDTDAKCTDVSYAIGNKILLSTHNLNLTGS